MHVALGRRWWKETVMIRGTLLGCALCLGMPFAALSNDSSAEISVGGIVLTPSDEISLDSEDLFISRETVRVKYQFTNTTDHSITAFVAFPLPDLKSGGASEGDSALSGAWQNALDFKTTVDGKPLQLMFDERAIFEGADITQALSALKLPVFAAQDGFHSAINALPEADRKSLIKKGYIEESGSDGSQSFWSAAWDIKATVTRQQIFPAGQTIHVEHQYKMLAGGSVGGQFEPQSRNSEVNKDYIASQYAKYCIDKDWLTSFDRVGKTHQTESGAFAHTEVWLGYILKSGANWKGPIKDFRMVIDKGKADSLVSFCGTGVKKIAPTQFEVRYKDFEPTEDVNVLIIDWWPKQ
jgi:hypothetical protein